jgi:hypothetical protein
MNITASGAAKHYLQDAARSLGTLNPIEVREVSNALEESLTLPVGDLAYRREPPLRSAFAEERSGHLNLVMSPLGPHASATDRTLAAAKTMEDIVGHHYGHEAHRWLKGHLEPVTARGRTIRWGAELATSFDRNGVRESMVTYEWSPDLMDAFPEALYRLARTAIDTVPGLRPAFSSIRCGRTSGSQQVTFAVDAPLSLNGLRPLMDALGLGDKHAGLMSAVAFVLGARFTLPSNSCAITLRPIRGGTELRLDVNLEAIPDLPPQLMSLLRLEMAERPQSLRSMDSWLVAMTPEGYETPGTLSILSFSVRPDMPARVNLHIRPPVLERQPGEAPPATVVADGSALPATASAIYAYGR